MNPTHPTHPPNPLKCHVISNTHWDREWRYPFQTYRMDLVDMMDRLLNILETRPEYRAFFLDSQTVILEDYLEIRPHNEKRIKTLVKNDRLQIGPWYTLPDEWGCPGEALVRNLLMGHRVAKRFGPVSKVGYTPFSNGQISQLPQLYQGFGIDSCFFYRGVGKHLVKSDFLWESPDGTRVFAFRFADYARYNYYYLVYRPGLLGRTTKDRDYIWTPEEIPYHVAVEQHQDRQYGWLNQKLQVHEEKLETALQEARSNTAPDAVTPELLYMMGHDHSFAASEEVDLIHAAQRYLDPSRESLFHSSLADFLKSFRSHAQTQNLQVLKGEMRHTNKEGLWTNLMATILSCRLYLKQQNARINAKIIHTTEPLAALAHWTGSEYPARFLEIAWKRLLINQAHDAIGGCSVDRVHQEMQARWSEVDALCDEINRRSMRDLVGRIDGSSINPRYLQLTLFNTLPFDRSGIGEFIIDLPTSDSSVTFSIETLEGAPVPIQILSTEKYKASIEGGYELSMPFPVQRHRVKLDLRNIPAMGYETLVVKPGGLSPSPDPSIVISDCKLENESLNVQIDHKLENEFLTVRINDNGTLHITDRRTGRTMDSLCSFEDTAELGDPWSRVVPPGDQPIHSLDSQPDIHVLHSGPLEGAISISFNLQVPLERDGDQRSSLLTSIPITLIVSLKKGSPLVDVTVHLENTAKDHRLRILFPTGVSRATHSFAEGQFDVLSRPIHLPDAVGWKEPPYPTNPMWNFIDVSDGSEGLAILNDGLTEYEVMDDAPRTAAITLLRTFGKFVFGRPTPGAQCLGPHDYHFAIYPHYGFWTDCDILGETARHITPFLALESAPTHGSLPHRHSFLRISPSTTVFSALKQTEDAKGFILRLWNPRKTRQNVSISSPLPLRRVRRLTLEEKSIERIKIQDPHQFSLSLDPGKIETVGFYFEDSSHPQ